MYSLSSFVKFLPDRSETMAFHFPDGVLIIRAWPRVSRSPFVRIQNVPFLVSALATVAHLSTARESPWLSGASAKLRCYLSSCIRPFDKSPTREGRVAARTSRNSCPLSRDQNQDRKTFPSFSFLSSVTIFSRASLAPSLDSHARITLLLPSPRSSSRVLTLSFIIVPRPSATTFDLSCFSIRTRGNAIAAWYHYLNIYVPFVRFS